MAKNRLFDLPELGDVYSDEYGNFMGIIGYSWNDNVLLIHYIKRCLTENGEYIYRSEQISMRKLRECCSHEPGKFEFKFTV